MFIYLNLVYMQAFGGVSYSFVGLCKRTFIKLTKLWQMGPGN